NWHAFLWTLAGGLQDVGNLGGGPGMAASINDRGQVVGWVESVGGLHAFSWTQAGGMVHLGNLGGLQSAAVDVDNRGSVVGTANTADGLLRAVMWPRPN